MSYLINDCFNNGTGLTSLYFLGNSLSNLETKTEHDNDIASINSSLSNIINTYETKTSHSNDISSINNTLSNLNVFQSDVGTFTRSTLSSSETVYYSHSLGHSPKNILFYGPPRFHSANSTSFGVYANNKNHVFGGGLSIDTSYIYTYVDAEGDTINGAVSSVSSSNFGIAWTRNGSITNNNLVFMFVVSG